MQNESLRDAVSAIYSVKGTAPELLTELAGYGKERLRNLPETAVAYSFGCGDPLSFLDVREGDVVLDLGCGAGLDLLLAVERVGTHGRVIGVDMTDVMLKRAR